jgi:hypothetical protein
MSVSASTLNEISNMQVALEKAEYQKRLNQLRMDGQNQEAYSVGGKVVSEGADAVITLRGVYGIGKRLYAIVQIDGVEIEFTQGDTYFGYRAVSIDPNETALVKVDGRGRSSGGKVHRLRLVGGGDLSVARRLPNLPPVPSAPKIPAGSSGPVTIPPSISVMPNKVNPR